jgi:poly-gamma-glutamate system protein
MPTPPVRLPAWGLTVAGVCAVAALVAAGLLPAPRWPAIGTGALPRGATIEQRAGDAERCVRAAAREIHAAKRLAGAFLDTGGPPDEVALIGSEVTPLVTTLGSLEAKRLAASPAWARRLTVEFSGAGVGPRSSIAASFSGSFPGLSLAVVCAAHALDSRVVAVSSVTASTWGATDPGFTWPEIEARLVDAGLIPAASVGVSVGGDRDRGLDLDADARALAESIADTSARRLSAERLRPDTAGDAAAQRFALLTRRAGARSIAVYVNVGGSTVSLGGDDAVLRLQTGWLSSPPADALGNGLLALFARRGTPVLHVLNVRELAARWGISR